MDQLKLSGRTAFVTGARRGIGRAVSLALAKAGADVAVGDLVTGDGLLQGVEGEIRGLGRRSLSLGLDISDRKSVQTAVERALNTFGRIDILVNCAGVWIPGQPLLDCSPENWDKVMDTNVRGTWFCCQEVGRAMVKQQSGVIINLSSQVGINPGAGIGAYSISKAAIIMLTRQLALELSIHHIRVNAIAPGVVRTDFNIDLWKDPESEKRVAAGIPLGRLAKAEDIARTALFLASDDSDYITGEIIQVDGGWRVPATPPAKRQS